MLSDKSCFKQMKQIGNATLDFKRTSFYPYLSILLESHKKKLVFANESRQPPKEHGSPFKKQHIFEIPDKCLSVE